MKKLGWLYFTCGIVGAVLTLVEIIRAVLTQQMNLFIVIFFAATWYLFYLWRNTRTPAK